MFRSMGSIALHRVRGVASGTVIVRCPVVRNGRSLSQVKVIGSAVFLTVREIARLHLRPVSISL